MLPKIERLVDALHRKGVSYCHWKSNWALRETLEGETDLDLLIDRRDARRFREILEELGFDPAIEAGVNPLPSVEHHHSVDEVTGDIVHVHAYYRVITGESLAKNYRLPVEQMLLANTREEAGIVIPAQGAELVIFVLRMLVKHTTPIELALLAREWESVRREVDWLMTEAALDEALDLLPVWLPRIDLDVFRSGFDALREPAPMWRRILLGMQIRRRVRSLARHHPLRARFTEAGKFAAVVLHRLAGSKKKLTPGGGGAVIAFVGSEATGKSTILGEMDRWLGAHFTVRRIHAGKPPSTLLTFVPHSLLPTLRRLLPEQRSTRVEARYADAEAGLPRPAEGYPLAFAVRSVMLAYERRALLVRAFARSTNGTIVLSDRYPSSRSGAPDSPQLGHLPVPSGPLSLRRWLTALEGRVYRDIPPPDLVIHLTAPLEVTLARNAARDKTEDEDFVRFRHSQTSNLEFDGATVHRIATDRPLDDILSEVRQAIWEAL